MVPLTPSSASANVIKPNPNTESFRLSPSSAMINLKLPLVLMMKLEPDSPLVKGMSVHQSLWIS